MTRKLRVLVAMLAALGSIGLGIPAASASIQEVPFQGAHAGSVSLSDQSTVQFSGTGNATYLSRISNDGQADITGASSGCPGGKANTNYLTYRATGCYVRPTTSGQKNELPESASLPNSGLSHRFSQPCAHRAMLKGQEP